MAAKKDLPPVDMARAFHEVLLEKGVPPGTVFESDEWEDRLICATRSASAPTLRSYTRAGKALKLWSVETGHGRGNKSRITLLSGPNGTMPSPDASVP